MMVKVIEKDMVLAGVSIPPLVLALKIELVGRTVMADKVTLAGPGRANNPGPSALGCLVRWGEEREGSLCLDDLRQLQERDRSLLNELGRALGEKLLVLRCLLAARCICLKARDEISSLGAVSKDSLPRLGLLVVAMIDLAIVRDVPEIGSPGNSVTVPKKGVDMRGAVLVRFDGHAVVLDRTGMAGSKQGECFDGGRRTAREGKEESF